MKVVALALATAVGIGYVPVAPGTFGSMAGLVAWALIPAHPTFQAVTIVVLFGAGAWSASAAEKHFNQADPGPVVIDEVMGMLLTLYMNPVGWTGALAGFLLFRFLDVVKPYPANRLERLPGGVGIMADDAMAAVYANLALRAVVWVAGRVLGWSL